MAALVSKLAPKILKWEGGFVNDPVDAGGATNMGITISTWKAVGYDKDGDSDIDVEDLKKLTVEDFTKVLKKNYWDRWKADIVGNQSVANILVDWVWGSGKWGIVIPQRVLGVSADGVVGQQTIMALNNRDQHVFFDLVFEARIKFLNDIVEKSIRSFEEDIQNVKAGIYPVKHSVTYWKEVVSFYNTHGADVSHSKYTNQRFIKGWMNRLNDFKWQG